MNRAFDYNGSMISKSSPTTKLTTLKRVVHIDSRDRDIKQYPTNGDMVIYLPRTYEKVVGISVKGAEFPPINAFWAHDYGATGPPTVVDYKPTLTGLYSFFLDIENLNRGDETAPSHDRTSLIDSTFAKFQIYDTDIANTQPTIYNESSYMINKTYYTPPIAKLDRLHIVLRTHSQSTGAKGLTGGYGYIYSSGARASPNNFEFGLSLEIETLENSFDDFSSIETRVSERNGGFWNTN